MLLVRDVMRIGVPVCRDTDRCGAVAETLARQPGGAEAVVVLDEEGMACGWIAWQELAGQPAGQSVGGVMDEDIPTIPPDIPAEVAAQILRDRRQEYAFLMHDWPGEPRPSAMISLAAVERRLAEANPIT